MPNGTVRTSKARRTPRKGTPAHVLDIPLTRVLLYPEDEALADLLREQARAQTRTLTGQIRHILREWGEKHGK